MGSTEAIREAAAELFLAYGYAGTSMDQVAAAANISKQTIYTHFRGKAELFADLVLENARRVDDFIAGIPVTFVESSDLEAALLKLARQYLGFVVRPEVLRLRRLIIGEATRFPELASRYYELVPSRVYATLAKEFGHLGIKDAEMAAQHFAWLTLGLALDRAMFYPPKAAVRGADLDMLAASAMRVFVSAYGQSWSTASPPSPSRRPAPIAVGRARPSRGRPR